MRNGIVYVCLVLMAVFVAWQINRMEQSTPDPTSPGLEVYLGEGCINCHSQYRRPVGYDVDLWGPPTDLEAEMERQKPVVFSNRRQGPDLSNIGLRRSRSWNREHLVNPRALRPGSRMPSYKHLFTNGGPRGEALLDYLGELGQDNRESWLEMVANWKSEIVLGKGDPVTGERLFNGYCSACHGQQGRGDGPMADRFQPAPRDLSRPGGWQWIDSSLGDASRRLELARTIKFGRPGTAMAGTEWLAESELADLIGYLETLEREMMK